MTNEQINRAIAEACGWHCNPFGLWGIDFSDGVSGSPPDYLNDLNAMHDAEKMLNFEQAQFFEYHLCDIVIKENDVLENPLPLRFSVCHAIARQRAEAFLRTLGKWKEEE